MQLMIYKEITDLDELIYEMNRHDVHKVVIAWVEEHPESIEELDKRFKNEVVNMTSVVNYIKNHLMP